MCIRDRIVDMLNVMEAHLSLMELENIRILKEMRGNVNRQDVYKRQDRLLRSFR